MAKSLPAGPLRRPPTHPGEVIAGILEDVGVSMRTAATAIGVSHTGLAKVLNGKGPVTPEMALRLEAWMGNAHPELWLNMQQAYDLWHARQTLAGELAEIKPMPGAPKRKAG